MINAKEAYLISLDSLEPELIELLHKHIKSEAEKGNTNCFYTIGNQVRGYKACRFLHKHGYSTSMHDEFKGVIKISWKPLQAS